MDSLGSRVIAALHDPQASHRLIRRVFIAGLGAVYFCAFISLAVQIDGLLGSHGIRPAAEWLERIDAALGTSKYWRVPTVFWLGASDAALVGVAWAGAALALIVVAGRMPRLGLTLLWSLYLSLASVGNVFLGFQWDGLLLETGLLAIFFAPATRWREWATGAWSSEPPALALWLLRLLLFKLMFSSGVVKLASGDVSWHSLRALDFHYFTQPLPTWTAVYAHHLPGWIHSLSVLATFAIEIALPFLILITSGTRRIACAGFIALQLMIAVTGNYGFFNLLSLVLCLPLLDDRTLRRFVPLRPIEPAPVAAARASGSLFRVATILLALVVIPTSLLQIEAITSATWARSESAQSFLSLARPLRSINSYGLFAIMTTERPEIVVEGSRDGVSWSRYRFRWKPGPLDRRPAFAGTHMPRLDWQMWFAALGSCRGETWFHSFLVRLLEGSAPVLALLEENPFEDQPPSSIRTTVFDYRFAPIFEGSASWWTAREKGPYCPPVTLVDGQLQSIAISPPRETHRSAERIHR